MSLSVSKLLGGAAICFAPLFFTSCEKDAPVPKPPGTTKTDPKDPTTPKDPEDTTKTNPLYVLGTSINADVKMLLFARPLSRLAAVQAPIDFIPENPHGVQYRVDMSSTSAASATAVTTWNRPANYDRAAMVAAATVRFENASSFAKISNIGSWGSLTTAINSNISEDAAGKVRSATFNFKDNSEIWLDVQENEVDNFRANPQQAIETALDMLEANHTAAGEYGQGVGYASGFIIRAP